MVHPLVQNDDGALGILQMGDGVLGEDGDAVGIDHLRDAVVDLRIHVVGTACQHDALHIVVLPYT